MCGRQWLKLSDKIHIGEQKKNCTMCKKRLARNCTLCSISSMKSTITKIDLGNNESLSRGIIKNNDGTFTALTFSASKDFKTYAGAVRWLARRAR